MRSPILRRPAYLSSWYGIRAYLNTVAHSCFLRTGDRRSRPSHSKRQSSSSLQKCPVRRYGTVRSLRASGSLVSGKISQPEYLSVKHAICNGLGQPAKRPWNVGYHTNLCHHVDSLQLVITRFERLFSKRPRVFHERQTAVDALHTILA